EKKKLQGKLIDGRYHGIALSCFIEGGAAGPRENARIELDGRGGATVYVGSANVGQGLETVCAQIAAEALDLPMDKIRVLHGSTILDAAQKLKATGARSAEGSFAGHLHTYSYGAAAAHVAVDARTGHVQVVDYLMVEDIGRVINPLTANGQAVGAVVQGLGG